MSKIPLIRPEESYDPFPTQWYEWVVFAVFVLTLMTCSVVLGLWVYRS